jgi:1,4-alpha-glucan branching enzyme
VIAFERAGLVFIFNLHPEKSFVDYNIGVDVAGEYQIILNSDSSHFGGHGRVIESKSTFYTLDDPWCHRKHHLKVYIPCRTTLVLALKDSSALLHPGL